MLPALIRKFQASAGVDLINRKFLQIYDIGNFHYYEPTTFNQRNVSQVKNSYHLPAYWNSMRRKAVQK